MTRACSSWQTSQKRASDVENEKSPKPAALIGVEIPHTRLRPNCRWQTCRASLGTLRRRRPLKVRRLDPRSINVRRVPAKISWIMHARKSSILWMFSTVSTLFDQMLTFPTELIQNATEGIHFAVSNKGYLQGEKKICQRFSVNNPFLRQISDWLDSAIAVFHQAVARPPQSSHKRADRPPTTAQVFDKACESIGTAVQLASN